MSALDDMEARGVRIALLAYADALTQALKVGVPHRTLMEHGIPRSDITRAAQNVQACRENEFRGY